MRDERKKQFKIHYPENETQDLILGAVVLRQLTESMEENVAYSSFRGLPPTLLTSIFLFRAAGEIAFLCVSASNSIRYLEIKFRILFAGYILLLQNQNNVFAFSLCIDMLVFSRKR